MYELGYGIASRLSDYSLFSGDQQNSPELEMVFISFFLLFPRTYMSYYFVNVSLTLSTEQLIYKHNN